MTPQRLKMETAVLNKYFPRKFQFHTSDPHDMYLDVGIKTQAGKVYRLGVLLEPDYPASIPRVFVVYPFPLRYRNGREIMGYNHKFHTLEKTEEGIEICHYIPENWSPNYSLFRVLIKARIWLECYDQYLISGRPIDDFINSI